VGPKLWFGDAVQAILTHDDSTNDNEAILGMFTGLHRTSFHNRSSEPDDVRFVVGLSASSPLGYFTSTETGCQSILDQTFLSD